MTSKPPSGHFRVLFFASANSYTKRELDNLKAPLPLSKLFDKLEEKYPGIKEKVLVSCAVTKNLEYVDLEEDLDVMIQEGDEVGIIPPVSSG
jgi:molybdopterin synthase sulfur carrier subunit